MDNKEQQIMKHYKMLIATNAFDEYDILGFLIFSRGHLENGCQTEQDGRIGVGYNGMNYDDWVNEWKDIGIKFDINRINTVVRRNLY